MQINEENFGNSQYTINSYEPKVLTVNQTTYSYSLMLTPHELYQWTPQSLLELTSEHLKKLLDFKPEIILVGTGSQQQFIHSRMLAPIIDQQVGFEIMATSAACRTFNLLAADGRRVVAGLLIN